MKYPNWKYIFLFIVTIMFISSSLYGQLTWTCDTEPSEESLMLMKKGNLSKITSITDANIRIYLHIIRRANGTGGFSDATVFSAVEVMQDDYYNDGIEFAIMGLDYINNDDWFDFEENENDNDFEALIVTNSHSDAIDIYFVSETDFGKADDIPSIALVIGGDYVGTSVLSHEMGHCLGLFHTHSGSGCGDYANCEEAINGSNCTTCGDLVCDTPADPCLSGNVNGSCEYTGPEEYDPDVTNIMSYAPPSCLDHLTDGQYDRAYDIIDNSAVLSPVVFDDGTTSGTLSADEIWLDGHTLTGNVTVPSGYPSCEVHLS